MSNLQSYLNSHPAYQGQVDFESQPIHAARATALDRFKAQGFPSIKQEAWKYTSTKRLASIPFMHAVHAPDDAPEPHADDQVHLFGEDACVELVFVNGHLDIRASSLPNPADPITVRSLKTAIKAGEAPRLDEGSEHPFDALNMAFLQEAIVIDIAPQAVLERPIHLLFVSRATTQPIVAHPRVWVRSGRLSQATLVQSHVGGGDISTLTNLVADVHLDDGAMFDHHIWHSGSGRSHHVNHTRAALQRDSRYRSYTFWLGGLWTRSDLDVSLLAPGAETHLNGLYVPSTGEHIDNHTTIDHRVPNCTSRELYKGILADTAKAVFNGRVAVHKDAQRTDSSQANRNLLLSKQAIIHTKPELEIYADDVSCAHGTTVGQLEEDELFYLRSRGINPEEARRILIHAFAVDLLDQVEDPTLNSRIRAMVNERLRTINRTHA